MMKYDIMQLRAGIHAHTMMGGGDKSLFDMGI